MYSVCFKICIELKMFAVLSFRVVNVVSDSLTDICQYISYIYVLVLGQNWTLINEERML